MTSNRPHTARKPVGSGSAFRPVPEYGPSAGQITSSPYVNAIPSGANDSDARDDLSSRRHSRESVNSDRFYDTEQLPENDGSATGVTTEATSPTIAQAPTMFPHSTPAHLYHRYDGSRNRSQLKGYQRLPSEGPEQSSQPLQATSRTPSNASSTYRWHQPESYVSSTSSLPKADQYPLRQHPAYQPYNITGQDSPASQFSEYSGYPLSMPEPNVPSPSLRESPAQLIQPQPEPSHTVPTHAPGSHAPPPNMTVNTASANSWPANGTHTSAHSVSTQNSPYYQNASKDAQDIRQDSTHFERDHFTHFKQPYLDSGEELGGRQTDRSGWYTQPSSQSQHQLPAKPLQPDASKHGQPFFVYGEPYARGSNTLDDDTRGSSDHSLSPSQSVGTERDSSLSLASEQTTNPPNVPAAVSELPPGVLYHREVSTSARPKQGMPLTLTSLANRNSSSDLSPHASGTQIDTPSSITSYPPFSTSAMPLESPISEHRSETASRTSRTSATSFSAASQTSRTLRDTPVPTIPESQRSGKPKDESLGIGLGSAYIQRIRVDAAETHISKVPAVLPIGIRARAKSPATHIQPEFLRKAMDIRYTHLPQRMLETEVEDDDVPLGQQQPPGVEPPVNTKPVQYESLDPERRSHSPVESVMERTGKIKLFVANPDDESD